MSKITLTNLVNLQNETTAVNAVNSNNTVLTTALDNTLSRDGTNPNTMGSNLDMNGFNIINLPAPTNTSSPLRLLDVPLLNGGGTITAFQIPAGGLTGQFLTKNSTSDYDSNWTSTIPSLTVTNSFSAPGILTTAVLNNLSITLGSTPMSFGNTYTSIAGSLSFTGPVTHTNNIILTNALTYGGVVLSNTVTGTGSMVLSSGPTLTGTLSFGTLSPTSFAASVSTVTGLTHNASPVTASDYVPFYSSANSAINKITVAELVSASVAGVSSINSVTGAMTLGGALTIASNVISDSWTTGDAKLTFKQSADTGWLLMNDQTIGDGSSGATYANTAANALFLLLYATPFADSSVPVYTSSGVLTTRGAQGSAATAWAAHCRLALPVQLGRSLAIAGSGAGLTTQTLGAANGSETHVQTLAELAPHTHLNGGAWGAPNAAGANYLDQVNGNFVSTGNPSGGNSQSTGSGSAMNILNPRSYWNVMIKL